MKMTSPKTNSVNRNRPPKQVRIKIENHSVLGASGWRKWALRLGLMLFAPCLVLLLLEAGLNLIGYGYPSSCFLKKTVQRRTFYIENSKFELRFFPPALLRIPSSYTFPASKDPNTFRIFVIGSSAAAGFPEPAYGFSRILEAILREKYPQRHFEIINTATTAINSNVDLPIIAEAATHEPDLFVLYDGHNETMGPFGPGTIFVPYSGSLLAIRSTIWLKSTKIGQLVEELRIRLSGKEAVRWRGMEMVVNNQIRPDDPRLQTVNSHFRANLLQMCDLAHRAHARVILATLGTNLKDSAPFASMHRTNLSENELSEWRRLYQQGIDAESKGAFPEAISAYEQAARIDNLFADLQFRLARSYQHQGNHESALEHYIRARDYDALRFRADSNINQVIREVAHSERGQGVTLLDIEKAFLESMANAPGSDLFYDHVHMNFNGNYLLARKVSEEIDRQLSGAPKEALSQEECGKKLAFTDWNRGIIAKNLLSVLQQAPFTNQLNHADEVDTVTQQMKRILTTGGQQVLASARATYEQALQATPDDWMLRNQYGLLLVDSGDTSNAVEQFRLVENLLPFRSWPHVALAQTLAKIHDDEAQAEYREALRIDPDSRDAQLGFASVFLNEGNPEAALSYFGVALKNSPGDPRALVGEGNAWSAEQKNSEATEAYEQALEQDPHFGEAHYRLALLLMRQGATDAAIAHLQKAVHLDFANPESHVSLGNAYESKSEWESALEQYLTAASIDPAHKQRYYELVADVLNRTGRHGAAQLALGDAAAADGKWREAASHYGQAVKMNSEVAEFHFKLATALHNLDREWAARSELEIALRINPAILQEQKPGTPVQH